MPVSCSIGLSAVKSAVLRANVALERIGDYAVTMNTRQLTETLPGKEAT